MAKKTTLEESLNILRCLKRLGIFPFRIKYKTTFLNEVIGSSKASSSEVTPCGEPQQKSFELGLDISRAYNVYRWILFIYFTGRTVLGFYRFFEDYITNQNYKLSVNFSADVSNCAALICLYATVIANFNRKSLIKVLNTWNKLEQEIQDIVKQDIFTNLDTAGMAKLSRSPKASCSIYILWLTTCILAGIRIFGSNIILFKYCPPYNSFLYNLIGKVNPEFGLKIVSMLEFDWFIILLDAHLLHFDIFAVLLPRSIANSLRLIVRPKTPQNGPQHPKSPKCSLSPKEALNIYHKIHKLVKSINCVYAQIFLVVKFCFLLCICLTIFLPIRYRDTIERQRAIGFVAVSIAYSWKAIITLTSLGSVRKAAMEFKTSWIDACYADLKSGKRPLQHPSALLEMDLINYSPIIAFHGGKFYEIKSHTVLTYFSVFLTWLVVLFQLI